MTPKSQNIIKVNLTHSYRRVLSLFMVQPCSGTQCCVWVVRLSGSLYCLCSQSYLERLMSVCACVCVWVWVCVCARTRMCVCVCACVCCQSLIPFFLFMVSTDRTDRFPRRNFPHTLFPVAATTKSKYKFLVHNSLWPFVTGCRNTSMFPVLIFLLKSATTPNAAC